MKRHQQRGTLWLIFLFLGVSVLSFQTAVAADAKWVEEAKKEGTLVWYTAMELGQANQIAGRFKEKYPFIKVDVLRTGGGPLLNRILAEARGGKHSWDVAVGRGEMILPLLERKLLASYRSPETSMISDDLVDREGFWTAFYANPYGLGFNTSMVAKTDVPTSYEALLDPKWKGKKISLDTEGYGLLAGLSRAWGREKALSYFKTLAAQEPVLMRGNTQRIQLVVAGEYPLLISYPSLLQLHTSKGAPIDWLHLEPAVVLIYPVMLAARSPNPNAGKLFIDFLLSKEGQQILVDLKRVPVRKDVDADPPRLSKGYKRIVEHPEDYKDFKGTVKTYQDIFNLR
jgi:ABC-type Fe3+ transport system substrate-binding protein